MRYRNNIAFRQIMQKVYPSASIEYVAAGPARGWHAVYSWSRTKLGTDIDEIVGAKIPDAAIRSFRRAHRHDQAMVELCDRALQRDWVARAMLRNTMMHADGKEAHNE